MTNNEDFHYHIDPVEFGAMRQEVKEIKEAIMGDQGLTAMVRLQNGRVRKLEDWKNKILGAIAFLSFLFGILEYMRK